MLTTMNNPAPGAFIAAPQQPPKPPRHVPLLNGEQEYFHHLMDELVALNQRHRKINADRWHHPCPASYAMAEATVQGNVGRQSGKSEYILRNATADDLIIVPAEAQLHSQFRAAPCRVITAGELERRYLSRNRMPPGERYRTIWIDEPYAVFRQLSRDELYYQLARDREQTFILLGP